MNKSYYEPFKGAGSGSDGGRGGGCDGSKYYKGGAGGSNLKQENYIAPEDMVLDYLERAKGVVLHARLTLETTIEVAKMIQLEEHREDK